jgi:hypothetical protein
MGSFNTTCFASGQTIAPGESCFVLPIVQAHTFRPVEMTFGEQSFTKHGTASQVCYPDAFWQLFGGFLEAEYNDYGGVKLIDNLTNRRRLAHFFITLTKRAVVVAQGENAYHDVPFDFPAFLADKAPFLHEIVNAALERRQSNVALDDALVFPELVQAWDYVAEVVHEHRLFAANNRGEVFPVEFAIMHSAAYHGLIALLEAETNYKGQPLDRRSLFDRAMAEAQEKTDHASLAEGAAKLQESDPELAAKFRQNGAFVFAMATVDEALSRLGEGSGQSHPVERYETGPVVQAYGKGELDNDGLFEGIKPALDTRYVMSAMDSLNIRIMPMVYAPQDYQNRLGGLYADFVQVTRARVDEERRQR